MFEAIKRFFRRKYSIHVVLSDFPSGSNPFVSLEATDFLMMVRVKAAGEYTFRNLQPNTSYTVKPKSEFGKTWVPVSGTFVLTPVNPTATFVSKDPTSHPNPWLSVAAIHRWNLR